MLTQVLREHFAEELGAGLGTDDSQPEILWQKLYLVISWDLCNKIFISVPAAVSGTTFYLGDADCLEKVVARAKELIIADHQT